MPVNTLSNPQRMAALQRANEVRTGVATFKRHVAAMNRAEASYYLAAAFESPTATMLPANVRLLLMAVDGVGQERARLVMVGAQVSHRVPRVRDLSERQRFAIARVLRAWGDRWA